MIKISNARALYTEKDKIWIAKGLRFFAVDFSGNKVGKTYKVGSFIFGIRLLRQLLRKGIHHLLPLKDGNILVCLKKKVLILDKEGKTVNTFSGFNGNKPGHRGICVTPNGYVFFGEYALNGDRSLTINLYRSTDNGKTFNVIKSFAPGEIRHIHFIEWDKYAGCIWLGTGDYGKDNSECRLYRSFDFGDNFELVGRGSQNWRSIALCPAPDKVYWGTDAGSCRDDNNFISLNRDTKELTVLEKLTGPCHGMCVTEKGSIYISTGVEGGENELDNKAKLYKYTGGKLVKITEIKKDIFPLIVQYGVIRFPSGTENTDKVIYTTMGLKGCGETVFIKEDEDYE